MVNNHGDRFRPLNGVMGPLINGLSIHGLSIGGGFKYFLFSSLLGEDSHFDEHIFQMGWFNHQLVIKCYKWR